MSEETTVGEKTSFTPGPWEYGPARNYVGFYVAPKGTRPTLAAVERSWGSWDMINVECFNFPGEAEANARLIAAAPELLEAVELMAMHVEADSDDMVCDAGNHDGGSPEACEHCQMRRYLGRLRALIARATTARPKEPQP